MREKRRISNDAKIAFIIELSVVATLLPRWIPALMLSEGIPLPQQWLSWWIPMSAFFNAGMAVTEAAAIAYIFYKWHNSKGKEASRLLWLVGMMLVTFSAVLAPFVASSISKISIQEVLVNASGHTAELIWGTAVALSTSFTVMAVGVAQGIHEKTEESNVEFCWCGFSGTHEELKEHKKTHVKEISMFEDPTIALDNLRQIYDNRRKGILPEYPALPEIIEMKKEEIE